MSFSFLYTGFILSDAILLLSDRKLGENKQKRVEIAVTYRFPSRCYIESLFFFLKHAPFVQITMLS